MMVRVGLVGLLMSAGAIAAPSAADLAAYKKAGEQLRTLITDAESGAKLQQLKTPQFSTLIGTIADGDRVLGSKPYQASELGILLDICDVANGASVSLMLFDLKSRINPKGTAQETTAVVVPLMASNTLIFQDELMKLQPFLFRCLAAEAKPMTEFVQSLKPEEFTEVRRQGLASARNGILQMYAGSLTAATDGRLREDYRVAILSSMAQTAPIFTSITKLADRVPLAEAATSAAKKSVPPFRAPLEKIAAAFMNHECEGLCLIQ